MPPRCRTLVLAGSVSSSHLVHSGLLFCHPEYLGSGVNAHAPQLGNPRRGHQLHGHGRNKCSAPRAPLGSAIYFPRRPGDRVGLGGAASQHARRQRQRYVHRIRRSALDWRWLLRKSAARSPGARRLPSAARGAGARHGRVGFVGAGAAADLPAVTQRTFAIRARGGTGGLTVYSAA
jgi:hypothetical protein